MIFACEARRLGERHSQLEAAVYLAEIRIRREDAAGALELLAAAESEAGDDAELYASALARVRGAALAALGRTEEACAQLESGLTRARDEGLLYEEALLLLTQGATGLTCYVTADQAATRCPRRSRANCKSSTSGSSIDRLKRPPSELRRLIGRVALSA